MFCLVAKLLVVVSWTSAVTSASPRGSGKISATEHTVPDYTDLGPSPGIIIGDVQIDPHRLAITEDELKWPNGVVPYVISRVYPDSIKAMIVDAMREIEHDVNGDQRCVQFVEKTSEFEHIRIGPRDGCHSYVGYQERHAQEVSIGKGCERKGIIMHELLHALGMYHEHNRPDRDDYVDLHYSNIGEADRRDFLKLGEANATTLGTPYDFSSIMHYEPYARGIHPAEVTITPKPGMAAGVKLGQRSFLSPNDVTRVQKLYGCPVNTSHITKPTGYKVDCNFEDGMCNLAHWNRSDFAWVRKRGPSRNGPTAGKTNGIDYYLVAEGQGHEGSVARFRSPEYNKSMCVEFSLFQRPKTASYFALAADVPWYGLETLRHLYAYGTDSWQAHKISVNVEDGMEYSIVFEAHMKTGDDVAIDDLHVYEGHC